MLNRREAVKTGGLLVAGMLVGSSGVLEACASEPRTRIAGRVLTQEQQTLIEDIADTLLPATATSPGAKAAGVGATINLILTDCYDASAQQRVASGLDSFRIACRSRRGKEFSQLARADRESFVREVDKESAAAEASASAAAASVNAEVTIPSGSPADRDSARVARVPHYFGLVRELALGAYFSSEIGMTKALRYVRVPGHYTGCMPLAPGQPAWA
jgi:Gluconate 2-dehydrogenase subunit 3